jgi:hypothetical protein
MTLICETPAGRAGASRNGCAGSFRDDLSPIALWTQFRIDAYHVKPRALRGPEPSGAA